MGGIKDNVHRGIAERVLFVATLVASGEDPAGATWPEFAYADFESAIANLPRDLESSYASFVAYGPGYHYYFFDAHRGASKVEWAREPSHIDWPSRLK